MSKTLGILGCGKMAYALTKGICQDNNHAYDRIYACDVSNERTELFAREFACITVDRSKLIEQSDVIIIAVKPAQVEEILADTDKLWSRDKLLISVAAGIKTINIESQLKEMVPIVRVMPNTPCLIGQGVSAISAGSYATEEHLKIVQDLLQRVGLCILIKEDYMDAVTAVSGSGPAYAFLVVEAMIDAALQVGLSRDIAEKLVVQTFKGSLQMLEETGQHPAVLKAQVTSPGGTTIAALKELEAGGLRTAFFNAVEKACQRSMEMGKH